MCLVNVFSHSGLSSHSLEKDFFLKWDANKVRTLKGTDKFLISFSFFSSKYASTPTPPLRLVALARTCGMMLNKVARGDILAFVPDLRGKAFNLPLSVMFTIDILYMNFIKSRQFPFIPNLRRILL